MRKTAVVISSTLLWASLVCSVPVVAQTEPDDRDVDRAEVLYTEAVTAFQAEKYERAATLFRASYDVVPKPELIYNEAVAWSRTDEFARALDAASFASELDLPEPMRTKNAARLRAWALRIETEETADLVSEQRRRARAAAAAQPAPDETDRDEPDAATLRDGDVDGGARAGRTAGVALGAVGLAALVSAAIIDVRIGSTADRLDEAARRGDEDAYVAALQRGKRLQTTGRLFLFSGAALLGTGVVVWGFSRDRDAPHATGTVSVGPGTARATLRF